jgi:hypothetical protein
LPNSIKSIGNEAFLGCGSLTNIVIPNSINYISNYAFTGIGNNLNVYCYKNSIADNINLYNENYKINFIYLDNMETPTFASESLNEVSYKVDGGNIYFNTQTGTITDCDSSVTKVDIPEQINGIVVTSIGGYAFTHSKITEVNIPGSVQRIEKYAFYSCSELKKVSIQKGVKYIGEHAFFDCMVLRDITLSEGLETIDNGAFAWCGINAAGTEFNIIIPRTVNYIGNSVFYGTFINNLTFKNKNTVIAEDLFDSEYGKCYKIYCIKDSTAEKYAIINNIPYELIEEEPISIPVTGGNIYLNPATQQIVNCDNSVTTAAIPESIDGIAITGISDNAFANCAILESITIPTTITTISSSAFTNCTTLKTVYCEKASVADNASLYPAGVTIITDFPLGDVNCDGKVTKEDAQLVLDYVKDPNSTTISSKGIENMHVTTDGLITSYNAACIEEKAEKDNYKFEVE